MSRNPFVPSRDHRFEYSSNAIEFIERTNCAKGCTMPRGSQDLGPGGDCYILGLVGAGDGNPIDELDDHGRYITCLKRIPPPSAPRAPLPEPEPSLFDG